MNKDDILNMPAGREMDALIANFILGLPMEHLPVVWEEGSTPDGLDGWSGFVCPRCHRPQDMLDESCTKNYSTDIAAAFSALYKWLDERKTYAVHIETVNITTGRLHDVILWGMDDDPIYDARAEDLALAISRVLLFAVMDNKNA